MRSRPSPSSSAAGRARQRDDGALGPSPQGAFRRAGSPARPPERSEARPPARASGLLSLEFLFVIEHAFGRSEPWSVGIEEELFVLDAETLDPAPFPPGSLDGVRFKAELFASVVELNTGVCSSVAAAVDELAGLRAEAKRRAGRAGLVLAASGTWPIAISEEQPITDDEGYLRVVDYA